MKRTIVVTVPLVLVFLVGLFALGPLTAQAATISAADAEQAALDAVPGTVVQPAELETEDGVEVYSVVIQAADGSGLWDVYVDANTGEVICAEPDDESGNDDNNDDGGDNQDNPPDQMKITITNPQNGASVGKSLKVVAAVTNQGKRTLQNIPLLFQLDGKQVGTQTVHNLLPGRSKKVTLRVTLKANSKTKPAAVAPASSSAKSVTHWLTILGRPAGSSGKAAKTSIRLSIPGSNAAAAVPQAARKNNGGPQFQKQVQLFDVNGQLLWQEAVAGNVLEVRQLAEKPGKPLGNGVYLYVVTTRDQNGVVIRRELEKLVVSR